jgi:hypothetical protein
MKAVLYLVDWDEYVRSDMTGRGVMVGRWKGTAESQCMRKPRTP